MTRRNKFLEDTELYVPEPKKVVEVSEKVHNDNAEMERLVGGKADTIPKAKTPTKKWLLTIVFILFNVLGLLTTALLDINGNENAAPIGEIIGTVFQNYIWILIVIGLFVVSFLGEMFCRYVLLRASVKKRLFRTSFFAAGLCKYYDAITPLGSGGQPFEIYYLRSSGIPGAMASGISIVCYAMSQFAFAVLAITSMALFGFQGVGALITVLAIVGVSVNTLLPLGILIFSAMPKVGDALAKFLAKILGALVIVKDKEKFQEKATRNIYEYTRCIKYFFSKYRMGVFLNFLCLLISRIALYSIPYCVMRMCGVPADQIDYFGLFALCMICYCSVAIFPTPGNSGAAELSFYSIFSTLLSGGFLFWGIISWRFASYYLFIAVGLVLLIVDRIQAHKRKKKQLAEEAAAAGGMTQEAKDNDLLVLDEQNKKQDEN